MYKKHIKRLFDILFSFTALVVLSPLFLIFAICVRVMLGSPAIFKQIRPGKNGKLFYIYKFRSMTDKTDENGNLLPDELRTTKFGEFLRRTSIDELPQLINILKGDMSLVGPRPRLVKDVIFYGSLISLSVRPGLTGRSQVYGRNDNSWHQVFEHDAAYAKDVSLIGDIKIFFLTFGAVFRTHQSEKRMNKFYADELRAKGIISEKKFDEGLKIARNIEIGFHEDNQQLLAKSLVSVVKDNVVYREMIATDALEQKLATAIAS